MLDQNGKHYVQDLPSKDSHISCTGLPICDFTNFPSKLPIQSNLQSIHERGHSQAWRTQRRASGPQTNRQMPPLGRTWPRSSSLVDLRTSLF